MYKLCVILVATAVCAVLIAPAYADDDDKNSSGRRQWSGQAQLASRIVLPGDPLHPSRCAGPAAILGGAGLARSPRTVSWPAVPLPQSGRVIRSGPIHFHRSGRQDDQGPLLRKGRSRCGASPQ